MKKRGRRTKEQRSDRARKHDGLVKATPNKDAAEKFKRPAYSMTEYLSTKYDIKKNIEDDE